MGLPTEAKSRVLDLGIGTGQTAQKILKKFSLTEIDGYDISLNMINQAKERLIGYSERVRFFHEDMIKSKFTEKYGAIISVLCIHHLNPTQKQYLFERAFGALEPEGIFLIADIVKFDSEAETEENEEEWKKFMTDNLGDEAEHWFQNYLEEDLPDSVNNQLKWLKEAGFDAECIWEHINYAVIVAKK